MTEETAHPFLTDIPYKTLDGTTKLKAKILREFPIMNVGINHSDLFWGVHESTEGFSQLIRAFCTDDDEQPF